MRVHVYRPCSNAMRWNSLPGTNEATLRRRGRRERDNGSPVRAQDQKLYFTCVCSRFRSPASPFSRRRWAWLSSAPRCSFGKGKQQRERPKALQPAVHQAHAINHVGSRIADITQPLFALGFRECTTIGDHCVPMGELAVHYLGMRQLGLGVLANLPAYREYVKYTLSPPYPSDHRPSGACLTTSP